MEKGDSWQLYSVAQFEIMFRKLIHKNEKYIYFILTIKRALSFNGEILSKIRQGVLEIFRVMPGVYSTRKRDHRGRDGNLSQIFTTFYDFGDGK